MKAKNIAIQFILLLTFSLFPILPIFSQHPNTQSSIPNAQSPMPIALFPWTGGLNSCQFCSIDLNLDGTNDLLVFDRHGNRRLPFINRGVAGQAAYEFDPVPALQLPLFHDWVIAADYDHDGRTDLFTYGNGGVRVFRNVSDTLLKFSLITDLLESYYYTGYVGILVTSVDYPAISDIDGDGDLDLLTFFGLGSFVEYHRNQSMEKYGHADSLDFRMSDPCWGKFRESESGNRITLNVTCQYPASSIQHPVSSIQYPASRIPHPAPRHTGSTMLATDLNGDGLTDLLLGDMDYPVLIALYNGGTPDSAHMVAVDTLYPSYDRPVDLFSMPAAAFLDVDNDGLRDLLVSPFDPSLNTSENDRSTWFYKNDGSNAHPHFSFKSDRFLRDEMADFGSASHPVLYDVDGDGLTDLVTGNRGYYDSSWYQSGFLKSAYHASIAYYRNTGTAGAPVFTYITDNLAGVAALHMTGAYPAPCELDGDGLTDLVCGHADGTLLFFKGLPPQGDLPRFAPDVKNWQGIDVGEYSAPQLFDLDHDGQAELIVGEANGNLNLFMNTGVPGNPLFVPVTDSLGKVNVTNPALSWYGYSTPCFLRDSEGTTQLIIGTEEGRIRWYDGIDGNIGGSFTERTGLWSAISATPADTLIGWHTSPAAGYLTGGETLDIISGNFSGGLNFISKRPAPVIIPSYGPELSGPVQRLRLFPNPAADRVTIRYSGRAIKQTVAHITDLTGRRWKSFQLLPTVTIDVTDLPAGYWIIDAGTDKASLIISR
jgi:hypothetical protein